ncbi:hypothetical protein SOVF_114030 [Spinacia oleracea]|nr:hypothetical protein SOVF_114030 [Spinacia oleracea]
MERNMNSEVARSSSISSLSSDNNGDNKSIVVRVKRKLDQSPLDAFCLKSTRDLLSVRFVVSRTRNSWNRGSNGVGELGDLKNFSNHSHYMVIYVKKDAVDARERGFLLKSQHLREIRYVWNHESEGTDADALLQGKNADVVLQGLQPHPNLRMLELRDYPGIGFPSWGRSSMNLHTCLPNLVSITLYGCTRLEHLPLMSQLRHLKFLTLRYLNEVVCMENSTISAEGVASTSGGSNHGGADVDLEIRNLNHSFTKDEVEALQSLQFDLETIEIATHNFSDDNKIGEGGFGPVYKYSTINYMENQEHPITFAWRNWKEGTAWNLVDPVLLGGSRTEILRCIHIGLLCVQESPADRPTMSAVDHMLNTNSVTLEAPLQPAFFTHSQSWTTTNTQVSDEQGSQ